MQRRGDALDVAHDLAPMILVSGKGGVGKTTIANRMATLLQAAGERVAVVRFANDSEPPQKLRRNPATVDHVVLRPDQCFTMQAGRIIGSRRLARTVLENRSIRRAIDLVPGVREVAMLMSMVDMTKRYDRVVVDLPSTGHGESWLQAPQTLLGVVDGGRAALLTRTLTEHLQDPSKTSLIVVATPEPFVLQETQRLCEFARDNANIETAAVIINRGRNPFDTETRRAVWTIASSRHPASKDAARLARLLSDREVARAEHEVMVEQLSGHSALIYIQHERALSEAPSEAA